MHQVTRGANSAGAAGVATKPAASTRGSPTSLEQKLSRPRSHPTDWALANAHVLIPVATFAVMGALAASGALRAGSAAKGQKGRAFIEGCLLLDPARATRPATPRTFGKRTGDVLLVVLEGAAFAI